MSNILYSNKKITIENEKKLTVEELFQISENGIRIKLFYRDDKMKKKITILSTDNESFSIMYDIDDKKTTKTVTRDELLKELAANNMNFAVDYIKKNNKKIKVKTKRSTSDNNSDEVFKINSEHALEKKPKSRKAPKTSKTSKASKVSKISKTSKTSKTSKKKKSKK